MNSTTNFCLKESDKYIFKWLHYLEFYDKYFKKFQNTDCKVLEIGVYKGGSLQMWKNFFGKKSIIIGFDIDENCKKLEEKQINIRIGNQNINSDLEKLIQEFSDFDVIIDDASHISEHQIKSFEFLFKYLNDGGIYLVEDLHTSYWNDYNGGLKKENTFIEFAKNKIDEINGFHNGIINFYTKNLKSINFHDSLIFFEKKKNIPKPQLFESINGTFKTWTTN